MQAQWSYTLKLHNYKIHLDYFILIYPSSFENLHIDCIKNLYYK